MSRSRIAEGFARDELMALVASLPPMSPDPLNGATKIQTSPSLVEELAEVASTLGRLRFGRSVEIVPKHDLPPGCALGTKGCEVVLLITPDPGEVAISSPPFPMPKKDSMLTNKAERDRVLVLSIARGGSLEAAQRGQGNHDPELQREPRRSASGAR